MNVFDWLGTKKAKEPFNINKIRLYFPFQKKRKKRIDYIILLHFVNCNNPILNCLQKLLLIINVSLFDFSRINIILINAHLYFNIIYISSGNGYINLTWSPHYK